MSLRLAIDAGNFARDRRGMGRVARAIARAALHDSAFETAFLLERQSDEQPLREAFDAEDIAVAPARSAARADAFDAVWFPWNGMRFRARAPSLLTINDAFAFTHPHGGIVGRAREQRPMRRGAREATQIVTCSQWSRGEIARELAIAPERIVVVPYAPDPFFFPGVRHSELSEWRYVLLVGVRERRKNARTVIEACAQAFTGSHDMLAIVGDAAPEDRRRIDELGLRHALLGEVNDETLRALYRGARAVAVPSTAEGFGLVAVEAMACRAATLAADAAALPESTRGGALLIDPYDVGLWRDALDRTLHDDAYAEALAARGAERFAFVPRTEPERAYLGLLQRLRSG